MHCGAILMRLRLQEVFIVLPLAPHFDLSPNDWKIQRHHDHTNDSPKQAAHAESDP